MACLAFGAVALWLLGYPDQALQRSREAVALGGELAQPSTLALALYAAAMLRQYRREAPAVQGTAGPAATRDTANLLSARLEPSSPGLPLALGFAAAVPVTWLQRRTRLRLARRRTACGPGGRPARRDGRRTTRDPSDRPPSA